MTVTNLFVAVVALLSLLFVVVVCLSLKAVVVFKEWGGVFSPLSSLLASPGDQGTTDAHKSRPIEKLIGVAAEGCKHDLQPG